MPVHQPLMDELRARYGEQRGRDVYFAMEAGAVGPFAEGNELHHLHEAFARERGLPPVKRGVNRRSGRRRPRSARS